MRDKALWTIILVFTCLALLDWLGFRGEDLVEPVRRLSESGESRLLGWAVLALVTYSVFRGKKKEEDYSTKFSREKKNH